MRRRLHAPLLLPALLLLVLAAGCSTLPRQPIVRTDTYRGLRQTPAPALSGHARPDQAVLDAFFSAYGTPPTAEELARLIPATMPPGRIAMGEFRRSATARELLPAAVRADTDGLWNALGQGEVLLLVLPPPRAARPARAPSELAIPVGWDQTAGVIEFVGSGLTNTPGARTRLPAADFFARRAPLRHAALRLRAPREIARDAHADPVSRLLLADFYFARGDYRQADALYAALAASDLPPQELALALLGRANILVQRGQPAQAATLYEQTLPLAPDNPRLHNNLAYALLQAGNDLPTALRHARLACDAAPDNPIYLETLGAIQLALGDAPLAAKTLEHAWEHALDQPEPVRSAILDQLARAWLAADNDILAWQVAAHRVRSCPDVPIPQDLLRAFPALKQHDPNATPDHLVLPAPPPPSE